MNKKRALPFIGALIIFIVCILRLGTDIGLADNGDFYRVISTNGIHYVNDAERYFNPVFTLRADVTGSSFFERIYNLFMPVNTDFYYSPHFIFIGLSKVINYIYNCLTSSSPDIYRIRVLGYLYSAMLSVGAYGIFRFFTKTRYAVIAFILMLFVFCDGSYLAYFNSFYGEPLQAVCVCMITAGLLNIYKNKSFAWFLAVSASSVLLSSKLVNVPVGVLVVICACILMGKKIHTTIIGTLCIACSLYFILCVPQWMSNETVYQSVFYGILKNTDHVKEYTSELGLPEEYYVLADTNAYLTEYPIDIESEEFKNNFYDKIGRFDVCAFYLRHPSDFLYKLKKSVSYASSIKPPSLSSGTGYRMNTDTKFSLWNTLRIKTKLLYNPLFVFSALLVMTAVGIYLLVRMLKLRKFSRASAVFYLYLAALYINLVLPSLANGEADLAKHMFFFIQLVDLGLCAGILYLFAAHKYKLYALFPALLTLAFTVTLNLPEKENDTVRFAGYEWNVIDETSDSLTLISEKPIAFESFDISEPYGGNLWEESNIRVKLNNDLFSENDYKQILPSEHYVTLPEEYATLSEDGFHALFWTHYADDVDNAYEKTYKKKVTDLVYLPTAQQCAKGNFRRDINEAYWLCEPYGRGCNMVRYIDKNGFVLHRDADSKLGIRPIIKVRKEAVLK